MSFRFRFFSSDFLVVSPCLFLVWPWDSVQSDIRLYFHCLNAKDSPFCLFSTIRFYLHNIYLTHPTYQSFLLPPISDNPIEQEKDP